MGDKTDVNEKPVISQSIQVPKKDKSDAEIRADKITTIKNFYLDGGYIFPKISNDEQYDLIYDILFNRKIPSDINIMDPVILVIIGDFYTIMKHTCDSCDAFVMTCKCNYRKGLTCYKMAADKGDPYGHYALGIHYRDHNAYDQAEQHFEFAAKHKITSADIACGNMHSMTGSFDKMIEKYKRAIDNGATHLIYSVGRQYYRQKDYENAVKYYMMGVANGCTLSKEQLIQYYSQESGFDLYNDLDKLIKLNATVDVKDVIIVLLKRDTNTFNKFITDYMDKIKLIDDHIKVESAEEANMTFSI